ncbi:XerC Integrase [uncultured Caudovirales phage]|uniref:Integrase n=1 Tax=uncultured Caudovirales phage TaxID=2100421 RepID=A0A6J5MH52_9CAUD|nr:XerC Integrase [uncultured Caudovirales phage]CAB4176883.1 XerC Integrase [uncultured Caudovirales phage]CAB4189966.1 XerC Integrase [uncultured Caudovirales phage]
MPEFRFILYRGKFSAEWYEESRRFRRSLGTDDKREATRRLAKFRQEYAAERRPDRITVQYAWNGYRGFLGDKPAGVTMGFEWKAIGPHFGDLWADAITEDDCLAYIAKRREQGRADGTIWTELGHLRSSLKWADKKGLILKAPTITRPERPAPRDKRLTREQAQKFLAACEMPHVRLFVILAMTTGARMGALLDLKWNRIDLERGIIRLHDPDRPKTNKTRAVVPMNQTARRALEQALEGSTNDYVVSWGGGKLNSIKKAMKGAGERAGLPWVTAHVFRHSAATWMAEEGVPMAEIAQFLGHADSRLTERIYARFSPKFLGKAAAALDFIFE